MEKNGPAKAMYRHVPAGEPTAVPYRAAAVIRLMCYGRQLIAALLTHSAWAAGRKVGTRSGSELSYILYICNRSFTPIVALRDMSINLTTTSTDATPMLINFDCDQTDLPIYDAFELRSFLLSK